MKIKFLGVGSAFTISEDLNNCDWQSNIMIISDTGKNLLVDCGSDIRFSLMQAKVKYSDIDAIYISHLHADHIGGLECLGFCTYFAKMPRPKLFCNEKLMSEMWHSSLKGGLESIQGKVVTLTEYFECHAISKDKYFEWEGITLIPVQTVHVMAGFTIKYSYGLLIKIGARTVFITTDTQFCPSQINDFYKMADIIFQDCETSPFVSGVHAHYEELSILPEDIKKKMWLYHYQPNPKQSAESFAGFVKKGQEFIV
jgi:ribonuclease BN (tRNA processing enzyme)